MNLAIENDVLHAAQRPAVIASYDLATTCGNWSQNDQFSIFINAGVYDDF
jgi:hypothetical protein